MNETMKDTAHVLGALFYYGPCSAETEAIVREIRSGRIAGLVPDIDVIKWQETLEDRNWQSLPQAWQQMFIGPHHFIAPPWGSVYLDPENVMFGASLLELRTFLYTHQLIFDHWQREAEDHIGLMLLLLAKLVDERPELVIPLLSEHLFPWVYVYLDYLERGSPHPFITLLAQDTRIIFHQWQETLAIPKVEKKIYWPSV